MVLYLIRVLIHQVAFSLLFIELQYNILQLLAPLLSTIENSDKNYRLEDFVEEAERFYNLLSFPEKSTLLNYNKSYKKQKKINYVFQVTFITQNLACN